MLLLELRRTTASFATEPRAPRVCPGAVADAVRDNGYIYKGSYEGWVLHRR